MVLGPIKDAYELIQALRKDLRDQPHGVNFAVVRYPNQPGLDHLRIANVSSVTIHGFRCWLQVGERREKRWEEPRPADIQLNVVYHPSHEDVFGNRDVLYRIDVPESGMWLHPTAHGKYYVLLSEIKGLRDGDLEYVGFSYTLDDGERKAGEVQRTSNVRCTTTHEQ